MTLLDPPAEPQGKRNAGKFTLIAVVLAATIGGFAAHWGGTAAPGLVAVGLSLANFVSAYFILP